MTTSIESKTTTDIYSQEESVSHSSSDDDSKKQPLPTFTNQVIVIRPETFYENKDCQIDNKFMKESPMHEQDSTNR